MKRILIFILTLCMVFALCACGGKDDPQPTDGSAVVPTPTASVVPEDTGASEPASTSGSGGSSVSQQGANGQGTENVVATLTAAEAENIALSDGLPDREEPQNIKTSEAYENGSVIGWIVEFDAMSVHFTYWIDNVTGDILDVQYS